VGAIGIEEKYAMSNILVTGGNGFIGSHLVNQLASHEDHRVTVFDLYPRPYDCLPMGVQFIQGNLSDTNLVRRTLVDQGIEVIYHLAWTTIHETALKNPISDIEQNLVPSVNLLEACLEAGVKRFIYLSSGGTVYGIPEMLPVREDHPTRPINAYGVTKLALEKYVQMYSYLYGMNYVIFRPSVPYGPCQNPHRRQGAVSVFIYHALRGMPVDIWGDGEVQRDYFYISDLSKALLAVLNLPLATNAVINLGGNQLITLNQLVTAIEQTLKVKIQVRYEAGRKFDIPRLQLDTHSASELLQWQPQVSLLEGIARTVEWIRVKLD
jgi:UDP-glucose 4-epimerase